MEEDYTLNYLALLACIVSDVSIERALRVITFESTKSVRKKEINIELQTKRTYAMRKARIVPTRVTDVINNKTYDFNTSKECAIALGISPSTVFCKIKDGKLLNNQYKFERINGGNENETRQEAIKRA